MSLTCWKSALVDMLATYFSSDSLHELLHFCSSASSALFTSDRSRKHPENLNNAASKITCSYNILISCRLRHSFTNTQTDIDAWSFESPYLRVWTTHVTDSMGNSPSSDVNIFSSILRQEREVPWIDSIYIYFEPLHFYLSHTSLFLSGGPALLLIQMLAVRTV
jgi:hypothetical protein